MPEFIHQYVQELASKRTRFARCFRTEPEDDLERALSDALAAAWQPLPDGKPAETRRTFAVDGASGQRPLSNGASFLVAQSLLAGPDTEESMVAVEVVRGNDPRSAERLVDYLRQYCEASLATRNLDRIAGGMLLVDGSLLADITHILALPRIVMEDGFDLREALVRSFLELLEGCVSRNILLVGVSKTARDTLLHPSLVEDPGPNNCLCDAEILLRFGEGKPGFTAPTLYGSEVVRINWDKQDPALKARAEALPCIGVMYARLEKGEDALRVDVIGPCIGAQQTLLEFPRARGSATEAEHVIRHLMAQHGGPSVYNAPLYAVDKMVRLSGKTMSGAYMALLREAVSAGITLDRSARRFAG